MGSEKLDAALQPIAEALLLLLILIAVAAISFLIINKVALKRKEKAHNKLSASKRKAHTWVDLSGGSAAEGRDKSRSTRPRESRRSSSSDGMVDILAKPKNAPGGSAPSATGQTNDERPDS